MVGARRAALRRLLELCDDEGLFAVQSDGRVVLTAQRSALGEAWDISRATLWRRIGGLVEDGLAQQHGGRLVIDVAAVRDRLDAQPTRPPTGHTRRYQALLEECFDRDAAGDWIRRDTGRRATLTGLAAAMGLRSRGTAHHHVNRIRAMSEPPSGQVAKRVAQPRLDPAKRDGPADPAPQRRAMIDPPRRDIAQPRLDPAKRVAQPRQEVAKRVARSLVCARGCLYYS